MKKSDIIFHKAPLISAALAGVLALAGHASAQQIAMARFNTNGSPDTAFGTSATGKLLTSIPGPSESATAIILPDDFSGDLIVAGAVQPYANGNMTNEALFARFDSRGRLKTSFGTSGVQRVDVASCLSEGFTDLISAGGGTMYATGSCENHFFVARAYELDGKPVTTFSGDGKDLATWSDQTRADAMGIALNSSTNVAVAVGMVWDGDHRHGGAYSVTSAGLPNNNFDDNAFKKNDGMVWERDVVLSVNDSYLTVGEDGSHQFVLSGYNSRGGNLNRVRIDFASQSYESANSITRYGDRYILGGYAIDPDNTTVEQQFALAKVFYQGQLDTSFDGDGKVLTDFSTCDGEEVVKVVTGGDKIYACGEAYSRATGRRVFVAARYLWDGSLDTSFDGDGKVIADFGVDVGAASCVAHQGGLVIVGTTE